MIILSHGLELKVSFNVFVANDSHIDKVYNDISRLVKNKVRKTNFLRFLSEHRQKQTNKLTMIF